MVTITGKWVNPRYTNWLILVTRVSSTAMCQIEMFRLQVVFLCSPLLKGNTSNGTDIFQLPPRSVLSAQWMANNNESDTQAFRFVWHGLKLTCWAVIKTCPPYVGFNILSRGPKTMEIQEGGIHRKPGTRYQYLAKLWFGESLHMKFAQDLPCRNSEWHIWLTKRFVHNCQSLRTGEFWATNYTPEV